MVFRDDYRGGYHALDPYENRQSDPDRPFSTAAEAQAQVTRWRQQAIVNFIGGALNGASFTVSLTGADQLIAERGEVYAMGQRAGTAGSIVAIFTGAGLTNALIDRFGRGSLSILQNMKIVRSALQQVSDVANFAADGVSAFKVSSKHLASASGTWAKFNTASQDIVQELVAEALRSPGAVFSPNTRANSFVVTADLGRSIGTKGQTKVKVIVGDDGKIWTAYPTN